MDTPSADKPLDLPDFAPVVLARTRHDGWTRERQCAFIAALVRFGDVAKAARAVGKSTQSAYALRRRPGAESFAAAWSEALEWASDRAVGTAIQRARHGITFARTYRGMFKGTVHRCDNEALITALRMTGRATLR